MSKLRSVNTHFWNDNYIIDLDPIEKLLFLYLLTNPNTNMLGVYELHIRKISFDTGIDKDMVLKIFDRFNDAGKASYVDGYVCLHNFTKHQSYNTNMKVSAVNTFNELPKSIKKQPFIESIVKALKPLPKGSEPIAKEEREYELEDESEKENINYVQFVDLWNDVNDCNLRITDKKREQIRARLRTYSEDELKTSIRNRSEDDWINGEGKKYKTNWDSFWRNDEKPERYLTVQKNNTVHGNKLRGL